MSGGVRELLVRFGGQVAPSLTDSAGKASRSIDQVGDAAEKQQGRAGKALGAIGGGFAGLVGPVAAAAAGIASVDFFSGAIAEAQESRKVGETTAQIIAQTGGAAKISADGIGDLATAISNKTGIDDEQIQSSANLLLTFKNVKNEVGDGANIFDRATSAAQDLAAAGFGSSEGAAKMLGKALNDPLKGISALGRAGVTFTDQQKDQIKTLVESGDTLTAQKMIMKEVESQVGGVAEKTATASDKLATMWGNTQEQLGTMLLPLVDKFASGLTDHVLPAVMDMFDWFDQNSDSIGAFFQPLADAVDELPGMFSRAGDAGGPFLDRLSQLATTVGDTISTRVVPGILSIADGFSAMWDTAEPILEQLGGFVEDKFAQWGPTVLGYVDQVGSIVGGLADLVGDAVQAAADLVQEIWDRWGDEFLAITGAFIDGAVKAFGGGLDILEGIVKVFSSLFRGDWSGMWDGIQQIGSGAWKVIGGIFTTAKTTLVTIAGAIGSGIRGKWDDIVAGTRDRFTSAKNQARDKLVEMKTSVVDRARSIRDGILGVFGGISKSVGEKFAGIRGAISSPLSSAAGWLNSHVLSPLNNVTSKFGVNIPQLPKFHTGGVIPGRGEVPIMALADEGVLSHRGMAALGGPGNLDRLNRGEPIGGFLDWIRKPVEWAQRAAEKGARWAIEQVFSAADGLEGRFPPPMAGGLMGGAFKLAKGAALSWAGGQEADHLSTGSSGAAFAAGKHTWPTNLRAFSGNYSGHSGVDIPVRTGSPLYAAGPGVIDYVGWGRGYGNAIFGRFAGMPAVYGHGSQPLVQAGQRVEAGQLIGRSGYTGNVRPAGPAGAHLHFEIAPNGAFALPSNRAATLRWLGYDEGGYLEPGLHAIANASGKPEAILTADQWDQQKRQNDQLAALVAVLTQLVADGGLTPPPVVVDGASLSQAIRSALRAVVSTTRSEVLA